MNLFLICFNVITLKKIIEDWQISHDLDIESVLSFNGPQSPYFQKHVYFHSNKNWHVFNIKVENSGGHD